MASAKVPPRLRADACLGRAGSGPAEAAAAMGGHAGAAGGYAASPSSFAPLIAGVCACVCEGRVRGEKEMKEGREKGKKRRL